MLLGAIGYSLRDTRITPRIAGSRPSQAWKPISNRAAWPDTGRGDMKESTIAQDKRIVSFAVWTEIVLALKAVTLHWPVLPGQRGSLEVRPGWQALSWEKQI